VSVFILIEYFKIFTLLFHSFIIPLYTIFYPKCTVMSHYFVLLLKQTIEVKTPPIAHITQFPTVALSCVSQSVRSKDHFLARIDPLAIRDPI